MPDRSDKRPPLCFPSHSDSESGCTSGIHSPDDVCGSGSVIFHSYPPSAPHWSQCIPHPHYQFHRWYSKVSTFRSLTVRASHRFLLFPQKKSLLTSVIILQLHKKRNGIYWVFFSINAISIISVSDERRVYYSVTASVSLSAVSVTLREQTILVT